MNVNVAYLIEISAFTHLVKSAGDFSVTNPDASAAFLTVTVTAAAAAAAAASKASLQHQHTGSGGALKPSKNLSVKSVS